MIAMTRSMSASARASPRRRWARSSAFLRSNFVRRTTTCRRWSRKWRRRSFSGRTRGCPSTIARKMTPNEDWSGVRAKSWFRTTCETASRFRSTTTRIPSRSDSSRMAAIPSIRFSLTSSAICSMSRALFTWNGISETTIASRSPFFVLSISGAPPHLQDAAPGPVGVHDPLPAEDDAAGREVGAREDADEVGERGVRILEEEGRGVARLGEVVRRDLRRHADGDPLGAVHEKIRERRRQDRGLLRATRRS